MCECFLLPCFLTTLLSLGVSTESVSNPLSSSHLLNRPHLTEADGTGHPKSFAWEWRGCYAKASMACGYSHSYLLSESLC
jgi:hypothetical protein